MECIEARALKSSFLSQMAMKTTSQVFYNDDVWCLTGINNVASDDFPVEDLLNLDFSEKEFQEGFFSQEDDVSQKASSYNSSSIFSGTDDFDSLSAGELAVPVDDLENLEWLSQFVDDSTSGLSLLCPAGSFTANIGGNSGERVEPVNRPPQNIRPPCFPMRVPSKARSKRSRPNGRPWSLASPPLSSADSSSTSSSSYGSSSVSPFVFTNPVLDTEWFSSAEKPPAKKQKRKPDAESGSVSGRRCTHCQVQKTPQWRTGPLGPKTLCNACGVRFKSGRLFPEYRPACSPTFSQEMHSNSHRKVLEMRRKKEVGEETEPGLTRVVQSMSL
ncbi:UNVERIFIED_CONTAM: GATA transcription factor 5 [Sesamum latifolium]|uniref:GATA transcription factor n=1 Tax=Sesamum latifolium TaxID=2727402 RepID=A0AAW2UZ63_9LAMI